MLTPAKLWQGVLVTDRLTAYQMGEEADLGKRLRTKWGASIRAQRTVLELTLDQLAERMTEIGYPVSAAAIGMWERGETAPRWEHQMAVSKALHTSRSVLFQDEAA